jgi:hypothetical protein
MTCTFYRRFIGVNKVTADTYTQAVTPVKRDAQARIAKLIMADGSQTKAITPTLQ